MKILVTGGAGFIGNHLVEELSKSENDIVLLDNFSKGRDNLRSVTHLLDRGNVDIMVGSVFDLGLLKKITEDVDVIYHMASKTSHRLSAISPKEYIESCIVGTENILEAARLSGVKLVFSSSSSVYGKNPLPFREDMLPQPTSPYATGKYAAELLCKNYHDVYGMNIAVLRYFNVIGSRMLCRYDTLLYIIVKNMFEEKPMVIHGENTTRDFTDVNDIVDGTILAAKEKKFNTFNLGTGIETKLVDVAKMLKRISGINVPIEVGSLKQLESVRTCADISKARRLLGYEPKRTLEETLKEYVRWYSEDILATGKSK